MDIVYVLQIRKALTTDLTPDYAAIPQEMKKGSGMFGKKLFRRGIQGRDYQ